MKDKNKKLDPTTLGLSGEYAVALEICRRNIYAQLTMGNLKRADLLLLNVDAGRQLRIEVKAKQIKEWPGCKGIYGEGVFLVFVDFENKGLSELPDFYILSVDDWTALAQAEIAVHAESGVYLDELNTPIWPSKTEKPNYRGIGVKPERIQRHKGRWDKIIQALS